MTSTEDGISIDIRPLLEKVFGWIRDNCESLSNVTAASEAQPEKQDSCISKTEPGIRIEHSALRKKAFASRRNKCDPASKTVDAWRRQEPNNFSRRTSVEDGTHERRADSSRSQMAVGN
jgi:hypothetical protein